jgi:hypothetical protein
MNYTELESLVYFLKNSVEHLQLRVSCLERERERERERGSYDTSLFPGVPHILYSSSENALRIGKNDIDVLIERRFTDCLESILSHGFHDSMPIFVKKHTLYIYDQYLEKWREWERKEMETWLDNIQFLILKVLKTWKDEKKKEKENQIISERLWDSYVDKYNIAMVHLMVSFRDNVLFHRIRHILLQYF